MATEKPATPAGLSGLPACSFQDALAKVQVQLLLSLPFPISIIIGGPLSQAPPQQRGLVSICQSRGSSLITEVLALPFTDGLGAN